MIQSGGLYSRGPTNQMAYGVPMAQHAGYGGSSGSGYDPRLAQMSMYASKSQIPSAFGPTTSGQRRALLIGVNYPGTMSALRGCHQDTAKMCSFLVNQHGFDQRSIVIMRDAPGFTPPTKSGILSAAARLTSGARPGDLLVFHFSGHGAQVEDPHGMEEDGLNEVILPCDWRRAGMISDDELNRVLVQPLPEGARLVALMDCCHAGTGLDLPYMRVGSGRFWGGGSSGWQEDTNPLHSRGDVVLFSGCEDDDTSAENPSWLYGKAAGVMTTAFVECASSKRHNYESLLNAIDNHIYSGGYHQRPQLSSSQQFSLQRPFTLDGSDAVPNRNPFVGRLQRKRFHAPHPLLRGPLRDELSNAGFGFALGYLAGPAIDAVATSALMAALPAVSESHGRDCMDFAALDGECTIA
eukprot:TRINITY_DN63366_c0_g2_i1.p1 TRINITY_DN63366_c0_g2~~TRINITY_DN63366_c0_g2_i1.p1  ORF type:complete len:409 (-),score=35.08 TRINITY_DN63366_c0_g2_i1:103-1329(-)